MFADDRLKAWGYALLCSLKGYRSSLTCGYATKTKRPANTSAAALHSIWFRYHIPHLRLCVPKGARQLTGPTSWAPLLLTWCCFAVLVPADWMHAVWCRAVDSQLPMAAPTPSRAAPSAHGPQCDGLLTFCVYCCWPVATPRLFAWGQPLNETVNEVRAEYWWLMERSTSTCKTRRVVFVFALLVLRIGSDRISDAAEF